MESLGVVVSDEVPDSRFEFLDILVFPDVDLLVFECTEESLDGDVVDASAFAVHRNGDTVSGQDVDMLFGRVLAALVGIEDFGLGWCASASLSTEVVKGRSIVVLSLQARMHLETVRLSSPVILAMARMEYPWAFNV